MRKQWKRLAAILGVAVLVVSQSNFVLAEEEKAPAQETQKESLQQEGEADEETALLEEETDEETAGEDEAEVVEKEVPDEEETNVNEDGSESYGVSDSSQAYADDGERSLNPATDLEWSDRWEGRFYNPNEAAWFFAYVYHESDLEHYVGEYCDRQTHGKGPVIYDLYHIIENCKLDGKYRFKVYAVYWDGEAYAWSEFSDESNEYTKPTAKLPTPVLTVSKSGVVSCEVSDVDEYKLGEDYGFSYTVYEGNNQIFQWGNNLTEVDLGELGVVKEGHRYLIRVQVLSRRINKLWSSDWAEYILDLRTNTGSSSKEDSSSSDTHSDSTPSVNGSSSVGGIVPEAWKPTTPDEIKRYAAYGKERVSYTTDVQNSYPVYIYNAMQGPLCFVSFEAVLEDYVIGRTYNILPSDRITYQMDKKAKITLNIPTSLQKDGRDFRMISVTQKGRPVVLTDLDSNPNTITFETDTYYAFALVYKDAK